MVSSAVPPKVLMRIDRDSSKKGQALALGRTLVNIPWMLACIAFILILLEFHWAAERGKRFFPLCVLLRAAWRTRCCVILSNCLIEWSIENIQQSILAVGELESPTQQALNQWLPSGKETSLLCPVRVEVPTAPPLSGPVVLARPEPPDGLKGLESQEKPAAFQGEAGTNRTMKRLARWEGCPLQAWF